MNSSTQNISNDLTIDTKNELVLSDFVAMTKPRLNLLVVFSSILGYAIGAESMALVPLIGLFFGGYFVTGASNIFNMVLEKDIDLLMDRTKTRPIPMGKMSVTLASVYGITLLVLGILLLFVTTNVLCTILSALSLVLYVFVYTPLKRKTNWAVFAGAFPGAFPPMIGYVAASGSFGLFPGMIFLLQFVWQFAHFWALAWLLQADYAKAGIQLLPGKGALDKKASAYIVMMTFMLIPVSIVLYTLGFVGVYTGSVLMLLNIGFLYKAFVLHLKGDDVSAKSFMLYGFVYLPVALALFIFAQ